MIISPLEYEFEGCRMIGQIAVPAGASRSPTVLLMHEARGIGGNGVERMRRLAEMGYVAFASDMYGEGARYEPSEAGEPLFALLNDPAKLRGRALAAVAALRARPEVDPSRIAALGFCFGGKCVLELARAGVDLKLFVSYHGLLTTAQPAAEGAIAGKVVAFCGDSDPYAPMADIEAWRREMEAARSDWQLTIYSNTCHAFTDRNAASIEGVPGVEYSPLADRLSWAATLILLDECIGAPSPSD